jgi:hypothetical protein
LLRLCRTPNGGGLILCSGYIYEPDYGYRILDDELLAAIVEGTSGQLVRTIAGKLQKSGSMDWLRFYRNFVSALRAAGVQVEALIAPERNWHAKIAVRLSKDGAPVAAIVGSSNLTGPAFGEGRATWNYESDVEADRIKVLLHDMERDKSRFLALDDYHE